MTKKPLKWIIAVGLVATAITGGLITCKPTDDSNKPGNQIMAPRPGERPEAPELAHEPPEPPSDEQLYNFLEKFDPERLQRLSHLEDVNPEEFHKLLEASRREFAHIQELKERNPEHFKQMMHMRRMEQESGQLARQYRECRNPQEKEQISKQLRGKLEKIFDLKEEQKNADISRMDEELSKQKEKAKTRQENRERIIKRHQRELQGDDEDMRW